jgi:hypothetical protein
MVIPLIFIDWYDYVDLFATACHAEPVEALAILPGLQQAKTNSE